MSDLVNWMKDIYIKAKTNDYPYKYILSEEEGEEWNNFLETV